MKHLKILTLVLVLLAVGLTAFADPINVGGTSFQAASTPINVGGTAFTASSPINVGGTAFTALIAGGNAVGLRGKPADVFEAELLLSPINVGGT